MTDDKDFGELVFRQKRPVPGVVLLRIAPDRPMDRLERLTGAIGQFGENLFGRYTVVDEKRVRSRVLPVQT